MPGLGRRAHDSCAYEMARLNFDVAIFVAHHHHHHYRPILILYIYINKHNTILNILGNLLFITELIFAIHES